MSAKIRTPTQIVKKQVNKSGHVWIQALKTAKITPGQVATWARVYVCRKTGLLKCKFCDKLLSILHISEHSYVSESIL